LIVKPVREADRISKTYQGIKGSWQHLLFLSRLRHTGMHPGIGDRYHAVSMQRKLDLSRSDSYDAWVEGNPDQEDGL